MKFTRLAATLLAATAIISSPALVTGAHAADQIETGPEFDVAFGVAVTSRYISRGFDQSRGPVAQAYIEPSFGILYAGVWGSGVTGSLVGIDPRDRFEYNLYFGARPEFGDLSFDFGYVHYFYNRSGQCCGEIFGKASYAFTEGFSFGGELYVDPRASAAYGALNAEIALPYDFSFSAAVGTPFRGNSVDWNAGISYTFVDTVTLDARYYDSNFGPARFVVSLSLDTTLSALLGSR